MPKAPKSYAERMRGAREQRGLVTPRSTGEVAYDRARGSAASRGYGSRWRKLRRMFLARNPLCVECLKLGRTVAASDVDHIIAKRKGGTDEWSNLQALCKACHNAKTAKHDRKPKGKPPGGRVGGCKGPTGRPTA